MKFFQWLFEYLSLYKLKVIGGLLLGLMATALGLVPQYLAGIIVDRVIGNNETEILYRIIAAIISATVLRVGFEYLMRVNFEHISQDLLYKIRKQMYVNLGKNDVRFFDRNRTGDIMARMTGDLQMIRQFVAFDIYAIILNVTLFVGAVTIVFFINFKMALLVFLVVPMLFLTNRKLAKQIFPVFSSIREQFAKLNTVVQENISGNRVVKAFAKEDYEEEKFDVENEEFMNRNIEAAMTWGRFVPLAEAQTGFLVLIVILVGGIFVINGDMSYGELVQFNGFLFAISNPMRISAWLINDVQRFLASAQKVKQLVDYEPDIQNNSKEIKRKINGEIEFENVTFRYDKEKVLKKINFKIEKGQKVGIVGPTGSGKSTLVSLINRFYDPTKGKVLIDGVDVRDYDIQNLRRQISYTFQDVFLFSDTIEGNVCYGKPHAKMDEIVKSTDIAGATSFIEKTEDGFDTIVGERGVGLSGGQKQRISLARALMYDGPILVLDDTTSAVDLETEERIQKELKKVSKDRTTIIIAHRISSVKDADIIFVMNKGRIIEKGTHLELLNKEGYYHEICVDQMGKVGEHIG